MRRVIEEPRLGKPDRFRCSAGHIAEGCQAERHSTDDSSVQSSQYVHHLISSEESVGPSRVQSRRGDQAAYWLQSRSQTSAVYAQTARIGAADCRDLTVR